MSEARDRPAATARILVVEDEALLQLLMADNLEDLGFKAEIAGSASAAKSLVASLEGDVAAAIVDMGLPDATGDVLFSLIISSSHPSSCRSRRRASAID